MTIEHHHNYSEKGCHAITLTIGNELFDHEIHTYWCTNPPTYYIKYLGGEAFACEEHIDKYQKGGAQIEKLEFTYEI